MPSSGAFCYGTMKSLIQVPHICRVGSYQAFIQVGARWGAGTPQDAMLSPSPATTRTSSPPGSKFFCQCTCPACILPALARKYLGLLPEKTSWLRACVLYAYGVPYESPTCLGSKTTHRSPRDRRLLFPEGAPLNRPEHGSIVAHVFTPPCLALSFRLVRAAKAVPSRRRQLFPTGRVLWELSL